jgi:hypothetical protein
MRGWLLVVALLASGPAPATEHACAAQARRQATALLAFHVDTDRPVSVEEAVTVLPPLANPAAPAQHFDVLQLWGHVYKATYRIRLLYAQVPGPCVLMGQEILDYSKL